MRSDKVDAEIAARLIEAENVNVVLVDRHPSKGLQVFEKLKKTKKNKWAPVYYDGRYAIFIKPDNPLNKEPIKIINQIRMEEAIERQRQQKKQPQIQLKKQPKKQPKNLIENKPSN